MSKKVGRPVKYRKLFNEYKKRYQKELAKALKAGEEPKYEQMTFRDFKVELEGKRAKSIEHGKTPQRRSRITTKLALADIYGSSYSQKQLKSFREAREEQLTNELNKLKDEAAQIVAQAKKENRLDQIEIEAKYRNDIAQKEKELELLKKTNATELRYLLKDFLKEIYHDLKKKGYTSTEAGKWISQNVFGSD